MLIWIRDTNSEKFRFKSLIIKIVASEVNNMSRLIRLDTWSRNEYGNDAPDQRTLRRWARDGHLFPPAEQHGKCWFVLPETKYTSSGTSYTGCTPDSAVKHIEFFV